MSMLLTSLVVWVRGCTPADRMVLFALADSANDDGEVAYGDRSLEGLASKADVSVSKLKQSLAYWRDAGMIEIVTHKGRGQANDYRLIVDELVKAVSKKGPLPGCFKKLLQAQPIDTTEEKQDGNSENSQEMAINEVDSQNSPKQPENDHFNGEIGQEMAILGGESSLKQPKNGHFADETDQEMAILGPKNSQKMATPLNITRVLKHVDPDRTGGVGGEGLSPDPASVTLLAARLQQCSTKPLLSATVLAEVRRALDRGVTIDQLTELQSSLASIATSEPGRATATLVLQSIQGLRGLVGAGKPVGGAKRGAARATPPGPDSPPATSFADPQAESVFGLLTEAAKADVPHLARWLGDVRRVSLAGDAVQVGVANAFVRDYWRTNIAQHIESCSRRAIGRRVSVTVEVAK